MTRARTTRLAAAAVALGLTATAAGCVGSAGVSTGANEVVIAISTDPGTLSPTVTLAGSASFINRFAYATLVNVTADGSLVSGVATKWSSTPTSAQFTIRPGVTCQDGSALTAADVAAEYNYIANPKNQSPMLGLAVPPSASAKADLTTGTVTVTTGQPAPFTVQMSRMLPLVCQKSLANPAALARATDATGPYELTSAVPGASYTYVKRSGYAWGPGGTNDAAMPDKVVFKVVTNESTAANLLLSGQINAAIVNGPDRLRLEAAKLKHVSASNMFGEFLFNEGAGHATADEAVRRALLSALDLQQIGSVATGGTGTPATNLETGPTPCTGNSVAGNLPAQSLTQAAAELTAAGWAKTGGVWTKDGLPLTVNWHYSSAQGPKLNAAAELIVQQWTAFGVKVTSVDTDGPSIGSTLVGGSWDVFWAPVGVNLPNQLTQFFDGPRPPQGNNFGDVQNPAYHQLVAQAMKQPGTAGCPLWDQADASLVKRADVAPFVDSPVRYYQKGATFQVADVGILPDTLRLSEG
ncbi:ABC transporter substrate-binding protein [Streptacidiphilus jiangxiensis]|uniref:ABC transporter substrate-binding protein n=1 Tax=Streptacidiphilus jiangxiensis TaxID=235985 RepID=UPI0005AB8F5E|nr:ABC transporter substrate-binding protein [Streptacidiphilus jiangxiensis]